MYRAGSERDTTPYTASFQLNHPRFDASAQHRALARHATGSISDLQLNIIKFKLARETVCGEEDSCFGSYKRPIRMSTTMYINSYRGHSFLIHLDFLEFKDFALSVWVFGRRIFIIELHSVLIWQFAIWISTQLVLNNCLVFGGVSNVNEQKILK